MTTNDLNRLAHTQGKISEKQALEKIAPIRKAMKFSILDAISDEGQGGLTPDEFPGLINTVRRRFTELWVAGEIRPSGLYRKNDRGNNVGVWVLGADAGRKQYKVCEHCHGRGKTEIAPAEDDDQPSLFL